MKYKNTLNRGSIRYIIFKEDNIWYGVALEFNILEEGDNPVEVMASLFQAIEGYVETAHKLKMRPMPLNQKPDKEYQELWDKLERNATKEATQPKQIYSFGRNTFPFKSRVPALVS